MPFQIIRHDITKVKADAIVNTANPEPSFGGGVDSSVYMAAGADDLLAARKKIGSLTAGQAAETPAFRLNAQYIIHTVAPVWTDGSRGELDILRSCYENSLALALKLKCRSVAFPLLAAGVNGFPKDKALQIAMSAMQAFVMEHSMKVTLVVFSSDVFQLTGNVIENIREYVDSNYVAAAEDREYRESFRRKNLPPDEPGVLLHRAHTGSEYTDSAQPVLNMKKTIGRLLAGSEKTFQEKLFEIIDERGLTGPQVYNPYVSKQVFSKIQSNKDYHPNKYTAIALCLSLQLDIDGTLDLIGRAGWTLSPSSKADVVVRACILYKKYDVTIINIILMENGCPPLNRIK